MEINCVEEVMEITKKSDLDLIIYLQGVGLLKSSRRCKIRNCRKECKVRPKTGAKLNFAFYCSRCSKYYSIVLGSFFENVHIEVRKVLILMWLWNCEIRVGSAAMCAGVRKSTVVQMYRYFRDIVSWKLLQEDELFRLGGQGHVLQIDEFVLTKHKYNGERIVSQKWVIGIYDTTLKRGYLKYLRNRSANELLPIIQEIVAPGSEIWTDEWRGYRSLQELGYIHRTVNHSIQFRDPVTGVCTNHVERFWSTLKQFLRILGVMSSPFLPEYIDLFMWRQLYGRSARNHMLNFTLQVSQKY